MSNGEGASPILTLEPLIEVVRESVEGSGWPLSGLQKTTSFEFEGRWEADSTRSAYLFFHREDVPDPVSIDVYLDETSKGLTGNLALVVDLRPLGALGDASEVIRLLGDIAVDGFPKGNRTPLTLRLRLDDAAAEAASAEVEARFKLVLPRRVIETGATALRELCTLAVAGFERVLETPALAELTDT